MDQSYIAKTSGIKARDKIGYAMGDAASLLVFGLVQTVLQKYYTDVAGIGIVSIMVMFIVARIWDAVNDPIWGRIIDRAKVWPDGRYRHWIKVFAVPVAAAAVLMFADIRGFSPAGKLSFAYVTYILFGMLYTCINIPYGSLAQVITSSDRERSSLSVFRSIGSTFGAMPAMVLISLCYVRTADGGREMSYQKILIGVVAIAALSVLCYFLCYGWSKERVETHPALKEKGQTGRVILQLLKSRPFMALCVASMLFLAAQMFAQSYNTYLFDYYFEAPGLTMLPTACQYLPVAVIMFFAGRMGNRFGRRDVCAWGMLVAGAFNLGVYLTHTHNVWIYLLGCLMSGIGSAFIFLLMWALATDAIDYNEINYGLHDEATSYAMFTFMRKLGQTVAAVLVNMALLRIGYTDNVLNTANIDSATLSRMFADSLLIPAVLFLLIFVILHWLYPLGKRQIDELQIQKEEALRRQAEKA